MVIGTFAYCGSGQDTLADSICRLLGYQKYSTGDILRNIAESRKLRETRTVLREIRKECDNKYGKSYIPNIITNDILSRQKTDAVITGIRTVEEYEIFKEKLDMKLIFVFADEDIRLQRMLNRKSEKDASSLDELKEQMKIEKSLFDYEKLESLADYIFQFNMPLFEYQMREAQIVQGIITEVEAC